MNIAEIWWSSKIAKYLKQRRLNRVLELVGDIRNQKKNILDVGSGSGKDFIQHFRYDKNLQFTAIDIEEYKLNQNNCKFMQLDAKQLPFSNKFFDLTVSFGVLEHITPIEKLAKIITEINRVSKHYCIIVPCINTFFEPHVKDIFWQLRDIKYKKTYSQAPLNYFSDEAWLSFKGFSGAKVTRFNYIPFIKNDLIIYK